MHPQKSLDDDSTADPLSSVTWTFPEEQPEGGDASQRLDIWVIPFEGTGQVKAGTLTLLFSYYHDEFIDIKWLWAMKQFASVLGLNDYKPDELIDYYYKALHIWEDNVDKQPDNPIMVSTLSEAYAKLGDLSVEIAGWWRLFERHPTRLSFLKFLHQACIAKYSLNPGFLSLLSFARLCAFYLLSRKAHISGLGHLDWWPLAREEEMMIFQPYMKKEGWVQTQKQHC